MHPVVQKFMQGAENGHHVLIEMPIVVDQPKERTEQAHVCGGWGLCNGPQFFWGLKEPIFINNMPQVL